VQKPTTWLTGLSLLWGDAEGEPVLMGAAAVFMSIHRTRSLAVSGPLANFGYRVLVPDGLRQTAAIAGELDTLLVQARRQAQIITWHAGADDLHVLQQLPRAEGQPRHPGVNAISDAWRDRRTRTPGTARCVDTSLDLGPAGLITDTAAAHGLEPMSEFAGGLPQSLAQRSCEALVSGQTEGVDTEAIVGSVLSSALATALLGGKHAGRLHWEEPLSLLDMLSVVAWEAAPSYLGGVPTARSE
jgi:hypothetical protein